MFIKIGSRTKILLLFVISAEFVRLLIRKVNVKELIFI